MATSAIEWTDATWNPVTGCTKVSPGCAHCYAEVVAGRFWGTQYPPVETSGPAGTVSRTREFTDVQWHDDRLVQPLRWRRPRRIFVNSMSDLFHDAVPEDFIARVCAVMALARQHTFQVLTKRADRMQALLSSAAFLEAVDEWISMLLDDADRPPALAWDPHARRKDDANATAPDVHDEAGWPLRNVWLGVSVEDQAYADERIPLLLLTPAALRFISAEPLLGPIHLPQQNPDGFWPPHARQPAVPWLRHKDWPDDFQYWTTGLQWVIVGGESGPGARPFDLAWGRSIVQQCQSAGVPVFVKQLGARPIVSGAERERWPIFDSVLTGERGIRLSSPKGGDMAEWPEDLRVREFPVDRRGVSA